MKAILLPSLHRKIDQLKIDLVSTLKKEKPIPFENLSSYNSTLTGYRDTLLANAVLMGELPAPTGEETRRIQLLIDRLTEAGLQNVSRDEIGNGIGVLPGKVGKQNILVLAHADTPFDRSTDHTMTVRQDSIQGPSIGDNTLGLATIALLPFMLNAVNLTLNDNLILLGTTRSLGQGDIEGLKFFLNNNELPIRNAICVEGVQQGRLSYASLGMLRGVIHCTASPDYDWAESGCPGAISYLSKIITQIQAIPLPQEPRTAIILGSISGGTAFNTRANKARLKFEVRSEQVGMVSEIQEKIEDIINKEIYSSNTDIKLEIISRRTPGGIDYNTPLVKTTRQILERLDITPKIAPSVGELSALIEKKIPSVTIGLTYGKDIHEQEETIYIDKIPQGLTQLICLLESIDKGLC